MANGIVYLVKIINAQTGGIRRLSDYFPCLVTATLNAEENLEPTEYYDIVEMAKCGECGNYTLLSDYYVLDEIGICGCCYYDR